MYRHWHVFHVDRLRQTSNPLAGEGGHRCVSGNAAEVPAIAGDQQHDVSFFSE